MPRLSSRSKHVEFESNSALQIRNQKERRAEKAGKLSSFAEGCENAYAFSFSFFFVPLTSRLTSFFLIFPILPFMYYGY